jgi:phytanoyl-CoA hydroxylase
LTSARRTTTLGAAMSPLPRDLGHGLRLRHATEADTEGLATFNGEVLRIFILGDPARFDSIFGELLREPALAAAAAAALGTDGLTAHFMNVTIKHPRFGRSINWHRDFPNRYFCTARPRFVRLMLCLDGMDEGSGATAFIPGSHLLDDAEGAGPDSARMVAERQPGRVVTVVCAPGDIVVIHPKVVHGGGGNHSDRWRRNVILQIGDSDEPLTVADQPTSITALRVGPAAGNLAILLNSR